MVRCPNKLCTGNASWEVFRRCQVCAGVSFVPVVLAVEYRLLEIDEIEDYPEWAAAVQSLKERHR